MVRIALAALAMLALSSAALADTPAPAATGQGQGQATAQPDANARRCVSVIPTGARVPRRTCRTNAEWAALRESARAQPTGDHTSCHADREDCAGVGNTNPRTTAADGNSGG